MTMHIKTFGNVYLLVRTLCQLSNSCNDVRVLKLSSRVDLIFVFYVRDDTYRKKYLGNKDINKINVSKYIWVKNTNKY